MGKTKYTAEQDAFSETEWAHLLKDTPVRTLNPVFLYDDMEQLEDKDPTRNEALRKDQIAAFLGLTVPLDENSHFAPGNSVNETLVQAERDALKLNICLPKHSELQEALLKFAQHATHWICTYFIHAASDVYIGNPEHFQAILESYMHDPCENKSP